MSLRPALLAAALLGLACRTPEAGLEPAPKYRPLRVRVAFQGDPRPDLRHRFEEALRDRLAAYAEVLPALDEGPAEELEVNVSLWDRNHAVAIGTGDAIAASAEGLSETMLPRAESLKEFGGRVAYWLLGGTVGLVLSPAFAAYHQAHALILNASLGYKTSYPEAEVVLKRDAARTHLFFTRPFEVAAAMRALPKGEARTLEALQKEQAEALARVVAQRLERRHGWTRGGRVRPEPETTDATAE